MLRERAMPPVSDSDPTAVTAPPGLRLPGLRLSAGLMAYQTVAPLSGSVCLGDYR